MKRQRGFGVRRRLATVGAFIAVFAAAAIAVAAEKAAGPRVLVDFEDAAAVKLQPAQAKAERVAADGGHALQITTEAAASWPGVLIEPRAGKWDLGDFDAVEMDVRNPQDVAVRVLLSINNPGADGQRNCNAESVNVPARGKAVLSVPFGSWHGETNRPLDQKNIVSLHVLLDRPGRAHAFRSTTCGPCASTAANCRPCSTIRSSSSCRAGWAAASTWATRWNPRKKANGASRSRRNTSRRSRRPASIRSASPSAGRPTPPQSSPYKIDPKFFERVDWAVEQSLKRKLTPVMNMHHYEEIFNEPDKHGERFLALWQQIAEHYKDCPVAACASSCSTSRTPS